MTEDRRRLEAAMTTPAMTRLWLALQPLRTTCRFLQTGAHPDDETSALLTRLARRDGVKVAFACALRGEGGQNAIGIERGAALGVLRTREMELATSRIPMRLYWLNEEFDGPIHDFGFAKSAEETFAMWGRERTLERLVRVIRHFRPDVMMPTFLDVEGQHGHHRAVTRLTEQAFDAAADPGAFPDQGPAPWQVKKLYLPAWSGVGTSYDDTEPPPPATIDIEVGLCDAATGLTFDQLGQWSRAAHLCQGMGRWLDPAPRSLPLHRRRSALASEPEEQGLFDGMPIRLADWAEGISTRAIADRLRAADALIDRCLQAFPDGAAVLEHATKASAAVRQAMAAIEADPSSAPAELQHRLSVKARELARAALEASGLAVDIAPARSEIAIEEPIEMTARIWHGGTTGLEAFSLRWLSDGGEDPAAEDKAAPIRFDPGAVHEAGFTQPPTAEAPPFHPYRFFTDPGETGSPVRLRLGWGQGEQRIEVELEPATAPARLPALTATPAREREIINLTQASVPIRMEIELQSHGGASGQVLNAEAPSGWSIEPQRLAASGGDAGSAARRRVTSTPPSSLAEGRYRIELRRQEAAAQSLQTIDYPHIARSHYLKPAVIDILATTVALPEGVRVAYAGAGVDRSGDWLRAIGLDVADLGTETLASGLEGVDSLVIGVMAFGKRPDLQNATAAIRRWVEAGGHLVTQYHRPWDGWDPELTPPRRLEIGQPSFRWRVTDPKAEVKMLRPDHPLLKAPNRIEDRDWRGWVKERGLYFAKSWDPVYQPLLEIADQASPPLQGGLLSAVIGKGRHTHVALNLFHQMDNLTPGAFRLFANLVQASAKGCASP